MSKRARDDLIELKFPIPGKRQAERKHKWYNAAWFIAETYTLNPKKNINEEKAAVEEGWRNFDLSTWPECIDDTMLALQTPRVRRLWADLWLQYATYSHASSLRLPPVQQMVSWAFRDIDKVAVLFGHPGLVIWVPFYGDIVLRDLKYTRIDDGIRALNPQVPITPYIVESVFLHIVWNDYWAESEGDISSFIDRELLSGGEMHEESDAESLFIEDDLSFGTVMTIPEVANSYEEFNTACHYLNPRSSIIREQVYESYRWLLTLKSGLTGYPLVEALKGALPTNMDAYHDAVKKVGARLSKQVLDDGAALGREPDKRFFSITYASHRMLKTTTTLGILPLVRFSFTPPPADRQLKKKVMADFAQQYRMLNAGVKLTKVDVDKAWRVILDAPLSAPAAGSEAAPDDTVAEKPPPSEDSEVRQWRGDEVQGLAEGRAAAGDESDTSQISTFEGLCRAASRREWRRERAAAAAAVEKANAGDSSEVGARV